MLSSGFHRGVESWGYAERKFHYYTRLYFFFSFFFFLTSGPILLSALTDLSTLAPKTGGSWTTLLYCQSSCFPPRWPLCLRLPAVSPAVLYPLILRLLVPLPTSDLCVWIHRSESLQIYMYFYVLSFYNFPFCCSFLTSFLLHSSVTQSALLRNISISLP